MAKAATRSASTTTLVIGTVEVPVALFTTVDKPAAIKDLFTTAGPNGGVLKARPVARPVPVAEMPTDAPASPVLSDPLAVTDACEATGKIPATHMLGGTDAPSGEVQWPLSGTPVAASSSSVDGEYGRELYEESTGEVVPPEKVRRGVRLEDGRFIDCTAELARIDEDTHLERMEVVRFVDITRVQRARVKGAYYVGAGDEHAPHALRVMFEGLRRRRRGAVVKLTKRSRQSLGIIGWLGECLVLFELVWAEDFREPPRAALRIRAEAVAEREVAMFIALIDAWSGSVDELDALRDDAIALREELHARALTGDVADVGDVEVVDEAGDALMRQLEASLAAVSA